jgi:Excalibur calcium-binding domain/Domain of unknown function (DUF4124)
MSSFSLFRAKTLAGALIAMTLVASPAASQVFKCTKEGSVTYQSDPCPTGVPRKLPSIEQLNAERQKKLQEAAMNPASAAASVPKGQFSIIPGSTTGTQAAVEAERAKSTPVPAAAPSIKFRCDGRIHCSKMNSCAEAKFFLSNCPGVKMDGDGDGIPCEEQWCN